MNFVCKYVQNYGFYEYESKDMPLSIQEFKQESVHKARFGVNPNAVSLPCLESMVSHQNPYLKAIPLLN